jgi:hypothetical protein
MKRVLGLLGQDEFAQACGLQTVNKPVVPDFNRFLAAQNVGAAHAIGGRT